MFEWIERSIRDKIIKEIESCIDYPEDDYERGLNRGMSIKEIYQSTRLSSQ